MTQSPKEEGEKKIASPFFEMKSGGFTSQEEVVAALRLYVAKGILKVRKINGEEEWTESDEFRNASKEKREEMLNIASNY
jgi:hypothetical protein